MGSTNKTAKPVTESELMRKHAVSEIFNTSVSDSEIGGIFIFSKYTGKLYKFSTLSDAHLFMEKNKYYIIYENGKMIHFLRSDGSNASVPFTATLDDFWTIMKSVQVNTIW